MAREESGLPLHPDRAPAHDSPTPPARPRRPRPSLAVRIALLGVGWLVLLVGFAGLFLPGLQGLITLLAGAAILSVASDRVHRWMQTLLHRWPGLQRRLNRLRQRLHDRLARR